MAVAMVSVRSQLPRDTGAAGTIGTMPGAYHHWVVLPGAGPMDGLLLGVCENYRDAEGRGLYQWYELRELPIENWFLAERPRAAYRKLHNGQLQPLLEELRRCPHGEAYVFNDYSGCGTLYYRQPFDPFGYFSRWDSLVYDRDSMWQCSAADLRFVGKAYHADWVEHTLIRSRL